MTRSRNRERHSYSLSIGDLRQLMAEKEKELQSLRERLIRLEQDSRKRGEAFQVKKQYQLAGSELQELSKSLNGMLERKEMQHPKSITRLLLDRAAAKRQRKAQRNLNRSGQ